MFKTVLSDHWPLINPVLQKHYGLKDGETVRMQGRLAVKHGRFIKWLMPFIRLTGALVPVEGDDFNVTVKNKRIGDVFFWERVFEKDGKQYQFNSRMEQVGNDIVEFVGFGIGIRMGLSLENGAIMYEDKGYVLKLGSKLVPIPLNLLMGYAMIEELGSIDNDQDIQMRFIVTHPQFGFAFSYMGALSFMSE